MELGSGTESAPDSEQGSGKEQGSGMEHRSRPASRKERKRLSLR